MPKIIKSSVSKTKIKNKNPYVQYLLSALKGLMIIVLLLLTISLFVLKGATISVFVKLIIYLSIALGSFICGYNSYKTVRKKGITDGAISGAILLIALIVIIGVLMRFKISDNIFLLIPVTLFSGIAGGIISANKRWNRQVCLNEKKYSYKGK